MEQDREIRGGRMVSMLQSAQIWEFPALGDVGFSLGEGARQSFPLGPPQKSQSRWHTASWAETVLPGQFVLCSLREVGWKLSIQRTVLGLDCINTVRMGMLIKV